MADDGHALERAIGLALRAHSGQRYPSPEEEPFIMHPLRMMLAVDGARARIAAVLHDVLEDTAVTVADLRAADVPSDVIAAVVTLTRGDGLTYSEYIDEVARNPLARMVKVADIADNLANNLRLPRTPEVARRIARYESALDRLRA